jgi:hypothetical protein
MMFLLALHKIAAARGDGLRPELVRLLEGSQADEANRASTTPENCENPRVNELETNNASPDPETPHENVLSLHDRSRKRVWTT